MITSVMTDRRLYPINWAYEQSDPALMLWTAALATWGMRLPQDARVLELGCAETDFLERLQRQNPDYQLTGVDCYQQPRREDVQILAGDGCNPFLFMEASFDAVVLLGALEHFGLGFYGDPVHEDADGECDGDCMTMQNVERWLKPRGWVYFDVPCNPVGRIQENRHFRQYAPYQVRTRLLAPNGLREVHRAYSLPEPHAGTWCDEPTEDRTPYHFVAVVAEKP